MIDRERFVELSPYSRPVDRKKLRFVYDEINAQGARLSKKPGRLRVLDLGAGAGALAISLAAVVAHVDAVDVDREALDKLRARVERDAIGNIDVYEHDATTFGSSERYDVIVASEMIENVPDMDALLDNIARLLDGNGIVIATVPNGVGPFEFKNRHLNPKARLGRSNRLRRLMGKDEYVPGTGPDAAHFIRYKALMQMFRRVGMRPLVVASSDWLAPALALSGSERLGSIDCRMADRLPRQLASGWYVTFAPAGAAAHGTAT